VRARLDEPEQAELREGATQSEVASALDNVNTAAASLAAAQAQLAYQQSYAMVDCIIRRNGFWSINRILDKCRRGLSSTDILAQEFGLTPAKFTQLWVEHYRSNLAR